ncbi:MAG: OmpH family outer membrane protein [Lachnospiraceae bacterium]|nr:OmpH family outer membrane protein [bacterium]MDY5517956.1 OmpH family outer membrane protein [Lachnospiraceae bacterium]
MQDKKSKDEKSKDEKPEFKDKLLTALQDSEIQSEIRKIIISGEKSDAAPSEIGSAKNEELQNKIEELKSKLEQMRNENERIHAESELLKQKNQSMAEARTEAEQQCEAQRKELEHQKMELKQYEEYVAKQAVQLKDIQNEISGYRVFDEAVTRFRAYCSLPSDVLRKAASIIRPESADLFFAMGCQKDNVLALWDFMKSEWERLGESETKILLETLTYFLKMINNQYQRPIFQWMDCHVGDPFDDKLHIRTADSSRYSGEIRQVCIPGIVNVYNGETVVRKSLVIV